MRVRRSTILLVLSVLCLVAVIYFGFLVSNMASYSILLKVIVSLICLLCLGNSIYTFSRYRYYKEWEETKLK